jgi:hypothetical protein
LALPRLAVHIIDGDSDWEQKPMRSLVRTAAITLVFAFPALPCATRAEAPVPSLELKPGQALTFAVTVTDGRVTLGTARLTKPELAQPKDGEVSVSVVRQGLSPYAALSATEKTSQPIDFVATGLIGDIKIDEIVVCGRLDAPATARIASGVWRVSLNSFTIRLGGGAPPKGEGGLGCPS